jgi:uncharacterized protein involved in exopolysaccharide biosynthesis/protein involved in polysaccharide export with SLBB domain
LAESTTAQFVTTDEEVELLSPPQPGQRSRSVSLRDLWRALVGRRRLIFLIEGGLLSLCLVYCLIAPNQFEASGKVELRTAPASSLNLGSADTLISASLLSAPLELETVAGELRSDQLAWRVISGLRLHEKPAFSGNFSRRFPDFHPDAPSPEGQAWLLDRFSRHLHVETIPRTLLIEIRFRSRDAALSAAVVNGLIRAYAEQDSESQIDSTAKASSWLDRQLEDLKTRVDADEQRLAEFETAHGIVVTPQTTANGEPGETEHNSAAVEIDELSRQLVTATTDRILAEAEYRAAAQGDPERVIAADPRLAAESGGFATASLQQIHARRSDLEQEAAQLSAEHGPNFPRVVEINRQLQDLDQQKKEEDAKLLDRFRSNWQTAADREQLASQSLTQATAEALKSNRAASEYAMMRQEADSSHELYLQVLAKVEEAGLTAGVHSSNIRVIDPARQPVKPATPDLPLYLAITFFAGLWVAVGGVLLSESLSEFLPESMRSSAERVMVLLVAVLIAGVTLHAQAPTPSTSGLPTGVASFPQTEERHSLPDPRQAPQVWDVPDAPLSAAATSGSSPVLASAIPGPIGPGDMLDISESHTPEFHSSVRVSDAGTVTLPMVAEVHIGGMNELAAAHAIEAALLDKGMLLHPLVSVLVLSYAGQDVSVLGEVAHPGVYPYTVHHRLLDLISAASGLGPNAGRLVNIYHASDPKTPHAVVLDPSGTDTVGDHNPVLSPGDTVQVSRAGLVYVVGDVIRPGGFAVDPVQGLTVVQALSLAWGPSMNASTGKAILIREQKGGRTLTTLNLRRMLHGQDPDELVRDRDIIYVPDSVGRNLWNRTMESAIQSTIGVTIYSALVYSQRY